MIERIKLNRYIDLSAVRAVENKLLLFNGDHHMLMITDVKTTTGDETYGRKNNKTRQVEYLQCQIYGYNSSGEFVGTHDKSTVERYLEYNLFHLRKNYLEFKKQWEAMTALEEKINKEI